MGTHAKLNYIHIFRAIAIIIIVAGHCFKSYQVMLDMFLKVILKDGTVLFVFIAGFLFQYLSDNFLYKVYLKKKFFNVFSPYLFTSIIGITIVFLYSEINPFIGVNKIVQIGMLLTTGYIHNVPTWYIPMTCIFFLFAAILLKLEKKIVFNKYSLLFFLLSLLICLPCFVPRYGDSFFVTKGMSAWQAYAGYLQKIFFYTILFFPIYILGMFFATSQQKYIKILYQKRFLLWGIFIFSGGIYFLLSYYNFLPGRLLLPKIVLTLLILGYLWHYDEKIMAYPCINNALGIIADYSFAIFFLHYYFIMGFHQIFNWLFHWKSLYLSAENFHFGYWIIYTNITFIIVFFGSLFLAMVIKKLLEKLGVKHTRYFIGV